MGMFKVVCGKCGSVYVLEKSSENILDSKGNRVIRGEGIQRKCIECDNEDFVIFKTWVQKN